MLKAIQRMCVLLLCLFILPLYANGERQIALTIDDMPFVGSSHSVTQGKIQYHARFMRLMNALLEENVPATGFVIAGSIQKGQWALLESFRQHGFIIGNHTHSHLNLNRTDTEQYIKDIHLADEALSPLMPQTKYFRYPYLAVSRGDKQEQVRQYLKAHHYVIAPVTIDSKDFRFNQELIHQKPHLRTQALEAIKKRYLNYLYQETLKAEKRFHHQKQILLIHANLLNSHALKDVIQLYKDRGYRFISLEEALSPTEHHTPNETIPPDPLLGVEESVILQDNSHPIHQHEWLYEPVRFLSKAQD